jgi:8-oxo-dGTP diphosphatase
MNPMQAKEQGLHTDKRRRYTVVPRSLIFVTSRNPSTGEQELLLLKGAPTKRLWANRYNGIGGHIESGEDVLEGARRELAEEAGLEQVDLELCGIINVYVGDMEDGPEQRQTSQGVLVLVFRGHTEARSVRPGEEGRLAWIPVTEVDQYPLVDDLYQLLPLILKEDNFVYGHYTPGPDGAMEYAFQTVGGRHG